MRNKQEIQRQARVVLSEFTDRYPVLGTIPIRISTRMTRAAGKVRFRRGEAFEIALSLPFFADPANDLREVVTHEAAHVIAGIRAGHGHAWKRVHRDMGGKAERCHTMEVAAAFAVKAKPRRRAPRVSVPCPKCGQAMSLGPSQMKKHARGARYSHGKCPR
jgi:predicted SprT family Zn-dependent metalloprotease